MIYWVREHPFASSSNFRVGAFSILDEDKRATKVFRHEESEADVSVGVDIVQYTQDPTLIELAIAFTGKPEGVFDEADYAEARAVYDKHWKMLSVSKRLTKDDRIYTFTLTCERARKKITSPTPPPNNRRSRLKNPICDCETYNNPEGGES